MADPTIKTKKLTRDKLASFLPNHESIKAFENLTDDVSDSLPQLIAIAKALAQQALDAATALEQLTYLEIDGDPLTPNARTLGVSNRLLLTDGGAGAVAGLDLNLDHSNAWTKNQSTAQVALVDAAVVAVDASLSNSFRLVLTSVVGGTRQLGAPTNATAGMLLAFEFVQPAAGGPCALTYPAIYDFGPAGMPTLSTTAGAIDFMFGYFDGTKVVSFFRSAGGGLTNPMTTPGDLIVGGVAGAPGRQGIGTPGQVPTVNAAGTALVYNGGPGAGADTFNVVNSLQTGVPFPVTDTSGATNVFTIALGGIVTLWDSVALAWTNYALTSQITTAIGTVSAAFTPEDWYLWQNAGVPTIERIQWRSDTITVVTANTVHYGVAHNLSTGDPQVYTNSGGALPVGLVANTLYWVITVPTSQDVTLSTTFGGTQLSITAGGTGTSTAWHSRQRSSTTVTLQDGRLCKSTDKTRRYIGSVWYDSTTTTSDTQGGTTTQIGGKRYVYNYYRRRALGMKVFDSTSFWTYVTATARSANNVFANRVEFFIGIQEQYVSAETTAGIGIASNSAPGFSGVGLNTNAVFSGDRGPALNGSASSIEIVVKGNDRQIPPLGYNFYSWIEYGPSSGTGNWIGSLSNSHAGMQATIEA